MDDQRDLELAKAVAEAMGDDVKIGPPPDAECKIHFLGQKILALDPKTNHLLHLKPHLNHPLVRERYFFTFPRSLWNQLHRALGTDRFEPKLAILEEALAESCDHAGVAGFWKSEWIQFDLLRRSPRGPRADSRRQGWNTNQQQLDEVTRVTDSRVDPITKVARGYAGWLLTNPQFLDDQGQLLEQWADMVQRWGLKHLGIPLCTGMLLPGQDPTTDPEWLEYKSAFETFFARWRLQRLAAPYLPVPLRPLLSGEFPASVVPQVNRAGGTFVLPDTFPIGTRNALPEMLTEAIQRPDESEHLAEWLEIVSGDNPARKPIARFARLLELQHYWRILHHRQADAIRRKLLVVKEVLASFLKVAPETIHRALLFLTKRLGKGWVDRGAGSEFGPF